MPKIPTIKAVLINKDQLNLKITIPGTTKYKFVNLEQTINPDQWDRKAGQCKKGHKEAEAINRTVFEKRSNLVADFEQDLKKGIVFTGAHITARIKGSLMDSAQDFYAFCRDQITVTNYSEDTRRTYRGEVSKMGKYNPVLSFADINYRWLQEYEQYLREDLDNHSNTVWKTFKFIKTMFNVAMKIGGIVDKNPFTEYKTAKYKQGIPPYVEWDEVQKLHKTITKDKLPDDLRTIGYYALLCFYSGLRFGDAVNFDYNKYVIEDTNGKRLRLYAAKNGEIVSIAFTKYISEVVDYIRSCPLKISNRDFNDALKILAVKADLSETKQKDLSAHEFRHGFAMRCCELGMSIDEVQKLLGHAQPKSTAIYFRVKGRRLDEAMSKWQ